MRDAVVVKRQRKIFWKACDGKNAEVRAARTFRYDDFYSGRAFELSRAFDEIKRKISSFAGVTKLKIDFRDIRRFDLTRGSFACRIST